MESVKVLQADLNDATDIARISYQVGKMHDEAVPEYFRPTDEKEHLRIVTDMLQEKNIVTFKAVCDDKICGFLFLETREREDLFYSKFGIITNMGIDAAFRGRGIGVLLIVKTEEYLKQQGIKVLNLDVFAFNAKAQKFFEKMGFVAVDMYMRKFLESLNNVESKFSVAVLEAVEQDTKDIAPIFYQMIKKCEKNETPLFKLMSEKEAFNVVRNILKNELLLSNNWKRVNFKAVIDGKIVGFLFLIMKKTESKGLTYHEYGYIGNFVVDEDYRERGIGVQLLKFAENYLYANGFAVLDLDVSAFNYDAIDFYKHHGFILMDVYMRKILG